MDPQQRLVLEVAWEALERAGQAPDRLAGSATGVFLGITTGDYADLVKAAGPEALDVYMATGNAHNAAAGRVSYVLGLNGPSMAVDTACSSSLVAVHLACQSLRTGESRLALAGGVNVILTPDPFVIFSRWGMMAPDGRCKTFDGRADGFVRSEGCGIVALKRLSEAQADGDEILAVIRGSAVNQDGASSGLTVPNGLAQQAVVRQALRVAGVEPDDVSYVEAHGTGTALGDPIELEALDAVFGTARPPDRPLVLGSVKTNLGHLESASGVAGLMKVVLALRHGVIPPHLHFTSLTPRVSLRGPTPVVPTSALPWPARRGPAPRGRERVRLQRDQRARRSRGRAAELAGDTAPERAAGARARPLRAVRAGAGRSGAPLCRAAREPERRGPRRRVLLGGSGTRPHAAPPGRSGRRRRAGDRRPARRAREAGAAAFGRCGPPASGLPLLRAGQSVCRHGAAALRGLRAVSGGRSTAAPSCSMAFSIGRCSKCSIPARVGPLRIDQTAYTQPALFALEYALAETVAGVGRRSERGAGAQRWRIRRRVRGRRLAARGCARADRHARSPHAGPARRRSDGRGLRERGDGWRTRCAARAGSPSRRSTRRTTWWSPACRPSGRSADRPARERRHRGASPGRLARVPFAADGPDARRVHRGGRALRSRRAANRARLQPDRSARLRPGAGEPGVLAPPPARAGAIRGRARGAPRAGHRRLRRDRPVTRPAGHRPARSWGRRRRVDGLAAAGPG